MQEDDECGQDRWLLSYADFITLLFVFFVVMYASSSINNAKYQQVTDAISQAFDAKKNKPDKQHQGRLSGSDSYINEKPSNDEPLAILKVRKEKMRIESRKVDSLINALVQALSPMIANGKIKVMQTSKGVRIDINDTVLFSLGSARIDNDEAINILQLIAPLLNNSGQAIEIEGHTDKIPIKNRTIVNHYTGRRRYSVIRGF